MTNIVFTAIGAEASAVVSGKLTSGMVGVPILFKLDSAWSGLNIVATFIGSGEKICVPLLSNREITVPWEVLVKPNNRLLIGLEGRSNGGTMVIPTVWANAAYVYEGAVADGTESNPPTPSVYDQILESIQAGMIKGDPGEKGEDGFSPTVQVETTAKGTTVTISSKDGNDTFLIPNGEKGEKGDPYVLTAEDAESITNILLDTGEFSKLRQDVDDIIADKNYENIAITGFSCPGAGTYEMGRSVAAPTVSWSLNKTPASQSLNGESLGVEVRSKPHTGSITSNKTYTLTVIGQKGEKATKSGSFNFYNGVYYGLVKDGATIDSNAILSLNKSVQGSRGVTFTVSPTSAMRIAYAIPVTGYGTPVFKDANSGFQVDMYRLEEPIQFENSHEYITPYYVWLSTYPQTKETKVVVS